MDHSRIVRLGFELRDSRPPEFLHLEAGPRLGALLAPFLRDLRPFVEIFVDGVAVWEVSTRAERFDKEPQRRFRESCVLLLKAFGCGSRCLFCGDQPCGSHAVYVSASVFVEQSTNVKKRIEVERADGRRERQY